jgi:hypothetical protein
MLFSYVWHFAFESWTWSKWYLKMYSSCTLNKFYYISKSGQWMLFMKPNSPSSDNIAKHLNKSCGKMHNSYWWKRRQIQQPLCFKRLNCSHLLTLVPRSRIFLLWRGGRCVYPKRRFTEELRRATSQKTAFSIVTAVKTSNLRDTLCSFDLLRRKPASRYSFVSYFRQM